VSFIRSKTFLVSIIGLLIVGAALLISFTGNRVKYGEADDPSVEVFKRAQQFAAGEASRKDEDNDGLYDWEETLWGSNPKKEDTDGDGTKDGEEVDGNRSPVIAGPDDKLTVNESTGEVSLPGQTSTPNETEKLAGEFFSKYFSLRQNGQLNSKTGLQDLFGVLLKNVPTENPAEPLAANDVLVGNVDRKVYGNVVGAILSRPNRGENEAVILLQALQKEDPNELEKLHAKAAAYEAMLRDLKGVVAPADAVKDHAALLNALSNLTQTIKDMEQAFVDPVIMMRAVARYRTEVDTLVYALGGLHAYFRDNSVSFETTEPGYFLMTVVTVK